jgi:magnesium transporter
MRSLKGKNVTWYDVVKPTEEDIAEIEKLHDIHPLIVEELIRTSSRTRIEHYDGYLFIVYHFPEYDPLTKTSRRSEVDFIITKNKIITLHYEPIKQLDALFEYLAKETKQRMQVLSGDSMLGVYYIFERAIAFSLRQLRHIEEHVALLTKDIFSGKAEDMLRDIS